MVAIENEYGGNMEYNHVCDRNYTYFLRDLFWSVLGNDVVLYTSKLIVFVKMLKVNLFS